VSQLTELKRPVWFSGKHSAKRFGEKFSRASLSENSQFSRRQRDDGTRYAEIIVTMCLVGQGRESMDGS